jgi:hypothetical protein
MQRSGQMNSLNDEVERFKKWAPPIKHQHGEWECDYEHWNALWSAAISTIDRHVDREISSGVAEDLLYVLARDNEAEYVRGHLVQTPSVLAALVVYATKCADADAKWQIVVSVAEANLPGAANLIRPFLNDEDEYVRRRSLMVYALYAPREAENIALQNLSDAFEYTRIAALHVLDAVDSPHLASWLDALENDPNEYVRHNVRDLREKRQN